ncbi:hypothetical protein RJ640_020870 [Escallonia rubra]|uniref:Chalcone/stilbene synthase N-terminal domain-containing protein n=1 Tax=Escallonia rubra TaxID=112253 RepID=A0AA88QIT0_9ASTE|nr:hypothetical protein RJ640_020870 [Escallonia rubra]
MLKRVREKWAEKAEKVAAVTRRSTETMRSTISLPTWPQVQDHPSHLVFYTSSGVDMPGADYQLTKLLGLRPFVKRLMMYQHGQFYYAIEVLKTKQKGERKLPFMKMTV